MINQLWVVQITEPMIPKKILSELRNILTHWLRVRGGFHPKWSTLNFISNLLFDTIRKAIFKRGDIHAWHFLSVEFNMLDDLGFTKKIK